MSECGQRTWRIFSNGVSSGRPLSAYLCASYSYRVCSHCSYPLQFALAFVAALVAAVSAITNPDLAPLIDEDLVQRVKDSGASWEATLNNQFASWTLGDAKKILGSRLDDVFRAQAPVVDTVAGALPAAFDSRTQWPGAIHPIRNQAQCGSCWAFGATEALSDRFAIETNLSTNVVLSPQDLVSCDNADGNEGCNGGYPIKAWQYMQATGFVASIHFTLSDLAVLLLMPATPTRLAVV